MTLPTVLAWVYFKQLGGQGGAANPWPQAAYAAGKVVQFALPVVYLWTVEGRLAALRRPRFAGWPVAVGFGVAVAAGMLGLYYGHFRHAPQLAAMPVKVRHKMEEFGVATPAGYVALAGLYVLAHSLLEEYYWRWFVFGRLRKLLRFGPAALVSSLAFMSHHVVLLAVYLPGHFLDAVLPASLAVAVGGAVWAWLYERADSVYPSWLSHALVDGALFFIGWDMLGRSG
jgi:membrane protease YdiL (CAAX protease family)